MISLLTSVLIRAYINKDYVGVERLIKLGADINTQDEYGYTMLMYAAITCDVEAVELLIKLGANVDVKDEYGYTALDLAHKFTQIKIINLLNIYKKMKITNRDKLINEIYVDDEVWLDKLLDKEIAERCIPPVVGYAFESYKLNKFEGKLYANKKLCQILFTVSKISYCEDVEKEIITELSVNVLMQKC